MFPAAISLLIMLLFLFILCYRLVALIKFAALPTTAHTQRNIAPYQDTATRIDGIMYLRGRNPLPRHSFSVANLIAFFQVCGEGIVLQLFFVHPPGSFMDNTGAYYLAMPRPLSVSDFQLWPRREELIK